MIILCPECFEKVSDKIDVCPNCGYSIKEYINTNQIPNQKICKINEKDVDVTFLEMIIEELKEDRSNYNKISQKAYLWMIPNLNLSASSINEFWKMVENNHTVPEVFYGETKSEERERLSKPHCPRCGSTAITAGQRGFKLTTGFLGSNKTVNRCANCGHTWKPGK